SSFIPADPLSHRSKLMQSESPDTKQSLPLSGYLPAKPPLVEQTSTTMTQEESKTIDVFCVNSIVDTMKEFPSTGYKPKSKRQKKTNTSTRTKLISEIEQATKHGELIMEFKGLNKTIIKLTVDKESRIITDVIIYGERPRLSNSARKRKKSR